MKIVIEIFSVLKFVLSILAPILFIANNFVCEYLYPNFRESWKIFEPMDLLCHQYWCLILFCYAIASCIKTKYIYGDLFLYFGMFLCMFDFGDRFFWGIYKLTIMDLVFTIPSSFIFSSILFVYVHKTRKLKS